MRDVRQNEGVGKPGPTYVGAWDRASAMLGKTLRSQAVRLSRR